MTGGTLRGLQERAAVQRVAERPTFASDEGGKSAGRLSECNWHRTMTGGTLCRLQELAAVQRVAERPTFASDEGGKSAGRLSECNWRCVPRDWARHAPWTAAAGAE